MTRGRPSKYDDPNYAPEPPPDNAGEVLAIALLGSEFERKGSSLMVKFDAPSDLNLVRKTLQSLRDCYQPPRD